MARSAWIETLVLIGMVGGSAGEALAGGARAAPAKPRPVQASNRGGPPVAVQGGGAVLTQAVRSARTIALRRVGELEECRDLFEAHGADGARTLLDADYRAAQPGEAGGLCEKGASAFTGMTSGRTAVCADSFLKLQPHVRAVVLLHEALHVAGLGQHPQHPGGMTPRQIDAMVSRSCDL